MVTSVRMFGNKFDLNDDQVGTNNNSGITYVCA